MANMSDERCPVCWGSHACGYPRGHDGNHACIDEDGPHEQIDRYGVDEAGFRWAIYTANPCSVWWPGGNCTLHEDHAGPHHDGERWYDDYNGREVDAPQP